MNTTKKMLDINNQVTSSFTSSASSFSSHHHRHDHDHHLLLQSALWYAEVQHWPVFPVCRVGKRPLTTRGFYAASTDVETILRWWRRWPEANIGLPTGARTGLVVLDVDARHGGEASLAALQRQYGGPLPTTRTTQTGGGGWHYWFAYPAGGRTCAIGNATNLGGFSGIDLRGTGGYVVVPPSRHESGQLYCWLREEPLAPFPAFLLDLACAHSRQVPSSTEVKGGEVIAGKGGEFELKRNRASPDMSMPLCEGGSFWLEQAMAKAMPGTRNATGFWLACQLRDHAVSFPAATKLLRQYAAAVTTRGSAPYTEREALRSLSSAYSRPPRPPARHLG